MNKYIIAIALITLGACATKKEPKCPVAEIPDAGQLAEIFARTAVDTFCEIRDCNNLPEREAVITANVRFSKRIEPPVEGCDIDAQSAEVNYTYEIRQDGHILRSGNASN
ncbi:MAG: hypothetical protein FWD15_00400 [Alphaproteobacteria bacterium]|nr:hypothetical protein [Alphaproteobacteria bacterium]